MTQEEANLLFKDICGRLRSGLICSIYREDDEGFGWRDAECKGYFQNNDSYEFYFEDVIAVDNIERLKPYLRPMSSMTEKEEYEYHQYKYNNNLEIFNQEHHEIIKTTALVFSYAIDWLNAHHFDYRGLIEKGLAIEAPNDMYNTKIE